MLCGANFDDFFELTSSFDYPCKTDTFVGRKECRLGKTVSGQKDNLVWHKITRKWLAISKLEFGKTFIGPLHDSIFQAWIAKLSQVSSLAWQKLALLPPPQEGATNIF